MTRTEISVFYLQSQDHRIPNRETKANDATARKKRLNASATTGSYQRLQDVDARKKLKSP